MEKNQQTDSQQTSLRQEPSNTTGTPAYRPVNEGDTDNASTASHTNLPEQHAEGSQPQAENETIGTP